VSDAESTWTRGAYTYDGSGNISQIGTDDFRYDLNARLVHGDAGTDAKQSYTYDRFGNILTISTHERFANGILQTDESRIAVDSATNKIDKQGTSFNVVGQYDLAGNLTSYNGTTLLSYDALNVVKEATIPGITERRVFLYTASDERIATISMAGNAVSETEWTLRDASGKVLRRVSRTPTGPWKWEQDYIYRGSHLLAAEVADNRKTLRFHLDHLGTPRLITANGGVEVARPRYFAFGQEMRVSADAEPMKFTGHERDGRSLDYMHARYYDPLMGRFLSVDPTWESAALRAPQSWNRYTYVRNNPVNRTDPDGRVDGNGMGEPLDWESGGLDRARQLEVSNRTAAGTAVLSSLFMPGPEDVPMALLGATKAFRMGGRAIARLFGFSDDLPSAGSIRDVNPSGSGTNCVNCAATVDSMLGTGRSSSALPSGPKPISTLGTNWTSMGSQGNVAGAMSKAGNGARGIVYVGTGKPGSIGHVFNVVNQKGVVRFLDGQTGKAVQWQKDWTDVRLLRTN
jgi:RHS repeat-associated protein